MRIMSRVVMFGAVAGRLAAASVTAVMEPVADHPSGGILQELGSLGLQIGDSSDIRVSFI